MNIIAIVQLNSYQIDINALTVLYFRCEFVRGPSLNNTKAQIINKPLLCLCSKKSRTIEQVGIGINKRAWIHQNKWQEWLVKISCSGDIQSMDVRRRLTYSPEIDNEMPTYLKGDERKRANRGDCFIYFM